MFGSHDTHSVTLTLNEVKGKGLAMTIKKGMHRQAVVLSYKVSTSHLNEIMVDFPI
jgi:hypothetical protein